jgi:hypothetical protein
MYQRTVQRWTLPARLASPKISRWSCRATVYIFLAASFDANNAGSAWCLSDWYDRQPSACYGRNRLFIISAYRYRSLFHKCSRGNAHADIWYIDRRARRSLHRRRVLERRILYGGRLRSLEARFADDRRSRLGAVARPVSTSVTAGTTIARTRRARRRWHAVSVARRSRHPQPAVLRLIP